MHLIEKWFSLFRRTRAQDHSQGTTFRTSCWQQLAMILRVIIIKCAAKKEFDENCTEGLRSLSFIDTGKMHPPKNKRWTFLRRHLKFVASSIYTIQCIYNLSKNDHPCPIFKDILKKKGGFLHFLFGVFCNKNGKF